MTYDDVGLLNFSDNELFFIGKQTTVLLYDLFQA